METAIKKISNLLALARSAAGTPEGDNAQSKALALAARWNLDIKNIEVGGVVKDGPQSWKVEPKSNSMWRASLAWAISRYAGVKVIRYSGRGAGGAFSVIGRPTDYDLWNGLYNRAEAEIDAEAKKFVANLPHWAASKSEGDTFRKNAAEGFGQRLAEYKREAEGSQNGKIAAAALGERSENAYALVLVGRENAIQKKVSEMFPKLDTVTVSSKGSANAAAAGYAFGKSMGVHRGNLS